MEFKYLRTCTVSRQLPSSLRISSFCFTKYSGRLFAGLKNGWLISWPLSDPRMMYIHGKVAPGEIKAMCEIFPFRLLAIGAMNGNLIIVDPWHIDLDEQTSMKSKVTMMGKDPSKDSNRTLYKPAKQTQLMKQHSMHITSVASRGRFLVTAGADGWVYYYILRLNAQILRSDSLQFGRGRGFKLPDGTWITHLLWSAHDPRAAKDASAGGPEPSIVLNGRPVPVPAPSTCYATDTNGYVRILRPFKDTLEEPAPSSTFGLHRQAIASAFAHPRVPVLLTLSSDSDAQVSTLRGDTFEPACRIKKLARWNCISGLGNSVILTSGTGEVAVFDSTQRGPPIHRGRFVPRLNEMTQNPEMAQCPVLGITPLPHPSAIEIPNFSGAQSSHQRRAEGASALPPELESFIAQSRSKAPADARPSKPRVYQGSAVLLGHVRAKGGGGDMYRMWPRGLFLEGTPFHIPKPATSGLLFVHRFRQAELWYWRKTGDAPTKGPKLIASPRLSRPGSRLTRRGGGRSSPLSPPSGAKSARSSASVVYTRSDERQWASRESARRTPRPSDSPRGSFPRSRLCFIREQGGQRAATPEDDAGQYTNEAVLHQRHIQSVLAGTVPPSEGSASPTQRGPPVPASGGLTSPRYFFKFPLIPQDSPAHATLATLGLSSARDTFSAREAATLAEADHSTSQASIPTKFLSAHAGLVGANATEMSLQLSGLDLLDRKVDEFRKSKKHRMRTRRSQSAGVYRTRPRRDHPASAQPARRRPSSVYDRWAEENITNTGAPRHKYLSSASGQRRRRQNTPALRPRSVIVGEYGIESPSLPTNSAVREVVRRFALDGFQEAARTPPEAPQSARMRHFSSGHLSSLRLSQASRRFLRREESEPPSPGHRRLLRTDRRRSSNISSASVSTSDLNPDDLRRMLSESIFAASSESL
eukprot:gnl/Chilomastix_cuspidata/1074.p1 GENE.gnl/Chilomastix_cuspidata/1074~~gnl/Chilomastix_cuspidata/1074.p1  ORF type:complete len:926 (+),score=279.57 gnl/Chilomastix_cuspidata/1074:1215-3992(+)